MKGIWQGKEGISAKNSTVPDVNIIEIVILNSHYRRQMKENKFRAWERRNGRTTVLTREDKKNKNAPPPQHPSLYCRSKMIPPFAYQVGFRRGIALDTKSELDSSIAPPGTIDCFCPSKLIHLALSASHKRIPTDGLMNQPFPKTVLSNQFAKASYS